MRYIVADELRAGGWQSFGVCVGNGVESAEGVRLHTRQSILLRLLSHDP